MCLILFALGQSRTYRLVMLANRDEFYQRPTAPMEFWDDCTTLAGRDLQAGGTWIGITRTGRLAAVTNFREPQRPLPANARSRGKLVQGFLQGDQPAPEYLHALQGQAAHYQGFNLLVGTVDDLWYYSNRGGDPAPVAEGIHGLSNHLLDTPWPKVVKGRERLAERLTVDPTPGEWLNLLKDREPAADGELPDTGLSQDRERLLSPLFITSPDYGTRSSCLVLVSAEGAITVVEQTWPEGKERNFHWDQGKSF